jgi:hypothetical protein
MLDGFSRVLQSLSCSYASFNSRPCCQRSASRQHRKHWQHQQLQLGTTNSYISSSSRSIRRTQFSACCMLLADMNTRSTCRAIGKVFTRLPVPPCWNFVRHATQ